MSPSSYIWQDPLKLKDLLNDEEKLTLQSAHRYGQETLLPRITKLNREDKHDTQFLKEAGDLGFLGMTLKSHGCAGASYVQYGLVASELERVDSSYRSSLSVQSSLTMEAIAQFGSDEQKERFLPALRSGEKIGAFALTEPNHGSDPSGLSTKATPDGKNWILNGSKTWITHAPIADILVIWAKDHHGQICGFVVERGMHGLETVPIHGKLALRASSTGMIYLKDVKVDEANYLKLSHSLRAPFACLNKARYTIAWGALGAAEDAWLQARQYALDRLQFGGPLAQKQLIQLKLADMQTELALAWHATLRLGRLMDEGKGTHEMISMLKRNNTQKALHITRMARDILGGNGIVDEYGVMRHMCNLEAVTTYEGTHDIHGLILGKAQTGLGAF